MPNFRSNQRFPASASQVDSLHGFVEYRTGLAKTASLNSRKPQFLSETSRRMWRGKAVPHPDHRSVTKTPLAARACAACRIYR